MARILPVWAPKTPGEMIIGKYQGLHGDYHVMSQVVDENEESRGPVCIHHAVVLDKLLKIHNVGDELAIQFDGTRYSKNKRYYHLYQVVDMGCSEASIGEGAGI